ncbi:uncharacterized protein LOC116657860 isoform X1 [Camelus ferus]|uniref:Uncharacterized protein LOC116657860 isoform X1 n=1 Tax=Camelus ferus TaxID=419612 RepID=A0A8B8RHG9_CAMFR|nr:uncharacterized protein LOC116657860 isoform X1 [Camelus ferus]
MHPPPPKSIPGVGCAPRKQTCDSPQYGSYSTCSERPSPRVCPRRRFCVAWTCFTYRLAGQHMDFYFLVHVLWLVNLLSVRRRKAIAEVWPCYCGALVSLVIFQHLLHLRLPPALCRDYPRRTTSTEIHSNLIKWLYLPDLAKKPDADLLLCKTHVLIHSSGCSSNAGRLELRAPPPPWNLGFHPGLQGQVHTGQQLSYCPWLEFAL